MNNEERIFELLQTMQSDMKTMQSDMQTMQSDIQDLKTRVVKIELGIENEIVPSIKLLAEGQQSILEMLTPKSEMEELKEEVEFLKSVVRLHAKEINELKKAQ